MDIFALNSLLIVCVFRLSDTRAPAALALIQYFKPLSGRTFMQKWKCLCEFFTFIDKDMTVNWTFLRWGRTRICQSAWQGKHYVNALT